jgi:hypothetical protein
VVSSRPNRKRSELFLLGVGIALGVACKPKPSGIPPLCKYDMASDAELESKALPPLTWLKVVSPSVEHTTMTRQGPLKDACARVVDEVREMPTCPAARIETVTKANDVVEAKDLVISQVGADQTVLWAATDELVDGEAYGSIALARWTERGIEIHGTGAVQGYREGARMRLHHASGIPVLVLESDRCDAQRKCTRIGQFVPLLARKFREVPVFEAGRGCIGRAQFPLTRATEVKIDNRWVRRFRMSRSIELVNEGVVLTDLVTVEDFDAENPNNPPTPFRRATSTRPLLLGDTQFELRDEDLYDRVLRDYGNVRPDR